MRLHQPRSTLEALEALLAEPRIAGSLTRHEVLPAREARARSPSPTGSTSASCRPSRRRGISALYSHQAEALEALRAGQDVAIVTPTASGKSLCYDLPVLQAIAEDPAARALYLFPTKALSQDQLAEFRDLAGAGGHGARGGRLRR